MADVTRIKNFLAASTGDADEASIDEADDADDVAALMASCIEELMVIAADIGDECIEAEDIDDVDDAVTDVLDSASDELMLLLDTMGAPDDRDGMTEFVDAQLEAAMIPDVLPVTKERIGAFLYWSSRIVAEVD